MIIYDKYIFTNRQGVYSYFKCYSNRKINVVDFFDDDFIGLDGISTKIYNKQHWIKAVEHDFTEIKKHFDIKIINFDARIDENGQIIVAVISLWCIPIFENSPEFDKMHIVFVLRQKGNSFSIVHLSNSVSFLPLTQDDVYPTELLKFLKECKASYYSMGKMDKK